LLQQGRSDRNDGWRGLHTYHSAQSQHPNQRPHIGMSGRCAVEVGRISHRWLCIVLGRCLPRSQCLSSRSGCPTPHSDCGMSVSLGRRSRVRDSQRGRAARGMAQVPREPSRVSRMMSAWPAWRAVSSIIWNRTYRTLHSKMSGRAHGLSRSIEAVTARDCSICSR